MAAAAGASTGSFSGECVMYTMRNPNPFLQFAPVFRPVYMTYVFLGVGIRARRVVLRCLSKCERVLLHD